MIQLDTASEHAGLAPIVKDRSLPFLRPTLTADDSGPSVDVRLTPSESHLNEGRRLSIPLRSRSTLAQSIAPTHPRCPIHTDASRVAASVRPPSSTKAIGSALVPMSAHKRIRLSSDSPPYYVGAKVIDTSYSPQTPTSPPHMSSATQVQPYDSSSSTNHSTSETQPTASTPATSVGGHVSFARDKDNDGDVLMSDQNMDDPSKSKMSGNVKVSGSGFVEHRRSDHDRQNEQRTEQGLDIPTPREDDDGRFYKLLQYRTQPLPFNFLNTVTFLCPSPVALGLDRADIELHSSSADSSESQT